MAGLPPFNPITGEEICAKIAEGFSLRQACEALNVNVSTVYRWMFAEPTFRDDLYQARQVRGDFFGEQILDIADDGSNDWIEAKNGSALRVNKEVVLRSKLRIEARPGS